jgi:heptosyltransferase II
MRIAFIKGSALGDVVRCTSIASALKRDIPEAEITWFSSSSALPLLINNPTIVTMTSISEALKDPPVSQFDWTISLDEDPDSASLALMLASPRLSGVYAKRNGSMSFTQDLAAWFGMGLLGVSPERPLHVVNREKQNNRKSYLSILYEGLGLNVPLSPPFIFVGEPDRKEARNQLGLPDPRSGDHLIGLFLGGSQRWGRKRWTVDQILMLAEYLEARLCGRLVVLGGLDEADLMGELARRATSQELSHFCSLGTLTAAIETLSLLITTDSLPLHLAVATTTPVVALFGPTSAPEVDLFGGGAKLTTGLSCRCCYLRICTQSDDCRDSIDPGLVVDTANHILQVSAAATLSQKLRYRSDESRVSAGVER